MMTFVYDLCQMLIQNGLTVDLQEKLDVFFAAGRLTKDQYLALSKAIAGEEPNGEDLPDENDKEAEDQK
ncbi:MAG: hypothetical protein E7L17_14040 [Clostridium sp.]|uniref:hypothetical protein n=1 Tax=Clostridium sp. TaxID=1506 RepID=UPI00290C9189|nr:hypothetical protein [Clostridium sp.]MDU7339219.1 hypothetical protein [Clostridium sp.]